jgi:hypothetical protein
MNRYFRSAPALCSAFALVALVGLAGCTRTTTPTHTTASAQREAENPWPRAVVQLRKENDAPSCRRILGQVNNDLAAHPDTELQPAGLTPDGEKNLKAQLRLTDEELKEIRPASYTGLDGYYLAGCLYLRDAARSLDVAGLPPARQAELAFAWVCRQVALRPWITPVGNGRAVSNPPVPPTYVLRRGSGSGLERAYVFVALLQQLGLDACFVGPADAAEQGWTAGGDPKAVAPPKGPFWAVGARVGGDVLLFEPWRGEALPGAGGKGVATLAQVKANPDLLKPWFDAKWDVAPEAVRAAVPFVAAPLSGLAPRMRKLEKELRGDLPVRLAVDPVAARQRFAAEAKLPEAKIWSPLDAYSYAHVLALFVPRAEGGYAPAGDPLAALATRFERDRLPQSVLFSAPPELLPQGEFDVGLPDVVQRIQRSALNNFGTAFLVPPSPRERMQRGHFAEVTPALVEKRQFYAATRERLRNDRGREGSLAEWAKKMRDFFAKLGRLRDEAKDDPLALKQVQQEVELRFKQESAVMESLVDQAVAEAGLAEATYLLAQCMHEQAERAQVRYERLAADPRQKAAAGRAKAKAEDAWGEAKSWWSNYDAFAAAQDRIYPGRAAHARRLAGRAAKMAASLRAG